MNTQLTSSLLTRRDSASDIDGNKYEAFGNIPSDLHTPVNIMTFEQTMGLTPEVLEEGDEESNISKGAGGEAITTDVNKGMFGTNAYSGELGVSVPMLAVQVSVDNTEFKVGELISESLGNLVWPCRSEVNPCKVDQFFKSDGYDPDFIKGVKKHYDRFRADAGIESDELCEIIAFWQHRIVPVCFKDSNDLNDFNSVIVNNYNKFMSTANFKIYEVNKKPYPEHEFAAKILSDGIL